MKEYKLFITIAIMILSTFLVSNKSFAQVATDSAIPLSRLTQAEQNIKDKIALEINRRLTSLTNLEKRIQEVKKLSEANKSNLVLQIQDQITSLNSLKVKIQDENDPAALKDDRKAVANQYRIYLLFIPKTHILATSDRILEISSDMEALVSKLQPRLNEAIKNGKDLSIINSAIDNVKIKIADADNQARAAADLVTPLVPDQGDQTKFTANKQALQDARKKLVVARQDLSVAKQSLDLIKQELNPTKQTSTKSAIKAQ